MKYTIIDIKGFTRKSTGMYYETKEYTETIDELVREHPHHDIYIYNKSLNTPILECIIISKYRITQRKYKEMVVIYIPEYYNNIKEEWEGISGLNELTMTKGHGGHSSLEEAIQNVVIHKRLSSDYVDEYIYL